MPFVYTSEGTIQWEEPASQADVAAAEQRDQLRSQYGFSLHNQFGDQLADPTFGARAASGDLMIDGLTPYQGPITRGVRGDIGGENATWGVVNGREVPVVSGYLLSDLLGKFGSIEAIRNFGAGQPGENGLPTPGPFTEDIARWNARPSNDFLSGKDGMQDAVKIALMAGAAFGGGALAGGETAAAGGAGQGIAGTAGFEAGAAGAGTGATGAASGLGTGLTATPNTSTVLGSSVGTAGTTAAGLGEGALGSGLAVPGGVGTGTGAGAGLSGTAAAGTALAPGYFTAEAVGGTGGAGTGATSGGSALTAPTTGGALEMIARGLPGALGAIGSTQQANAYGDLARDYMAVGAPSRARFEASYAPGFSMENDPGFQDALKQSAKATLHGLSIGGNPAGNPNAWAQSLTDLYQKTAYQALQQYRNQNAAAGGLAALTQAAPQAAGNAISAQGNIFNSVGAAANDIFNPPKSLTQILREIRSAGY